MTEPMNDEPTDTVVMLRALANDPALTIGQAWNALEHAANVIEALRTLENPIRSAAEPDEESRLVTELAERIHGVIKKTDRRILEASAQLMVSACITSNAANYTLKLGGVTHDGENHGDWTIIAQKVEADSSRRPDPPEVDEAVRNACQAAVAWMDSHGEQVFAGGGWSAVESMNATRAALTAAHKPAAGSGEGNANG